MSGIPTTRYSRILKILQGIAQLVSFDLVCYFLRSLRASFKVELSSQFL